MFILTFSRLRHDKPQYRVDEKFFDRDGLWVHAKNFDALVMCLKKGWRCFSHDRDNHVLCSDGTIWAYPGKEIDSNTICVMPEWKENTKDSRNHHKICKGICSDYVQDYKNGMKS